VQLFTVLLLFTWRLGNDSARAIGVASVVARAGVDAMAGDDGGNDG